MLVNNWEEEKAVPWNKMPNNKSKKKKKDGIRKLSFGHHHSNNSFRQETSMDIKIIR